MIVYDNEANIPVPDNFKRIFTDVEKYIVDPNDITIRFKFDKNVSTPTCISDKEDCEKRRCWITFPQSFTNLRDETRIRFYFAHELSHYISKCVCRDHMFPISSLKYLHDDEFIKFLGNTKGVKIFLNLVGDIHGNRVLVNKSYFPELFSELKEEYFKDSRAVNSRPGILEALIDIAASDFSLSMSLENKEDKSKEYFQDFMEKIEPLKGSKILRIYKEFRSKLIALDKLTIDTAFKSLKECVENK